MRPVPAGLLAFHIEAQRVAGIQELRVGRVVAQAHSIHIHALNQLDILNILGLRQRTTCLWTERMTIDTLEDHLLSIDKHAILLITIIRVTIFNSTETKLLAFYMKCLAL